MSATTTEVTAREFRADLENLLRLAQDVASAEAKLEAFAEEVKKEEKWWRIRGLPGGRFVPLDASVREALRSALNDHGNSDHYGLEKCQDAQDALDVLDFAIEREHLDEVAS